MASFADDFGDFDVSGLTIGKAPASSKADDKASKANAPRHYSVKQINVIRTKAHEKAVSAHAAAVAAGSTAKAPIAPKRYSAGAKYKASVEAGKSYG